MWLQRLQTLVKGEVWKGGQENDVRVQEGLLRQLVQQGFEREAAKAALKKTNNDDFAALLILTSPQEAEPDNKTDFSSDDSNEAKQQRLLDYFRDLGDQYWGWQNESAKRGRGFKGALKSNFLPLLDDIRRLAADDLPFCDSFAVPYQALCFLNRGLDECPPMAEDRDRDRYRMSKETGPILPKLLSRIANLNQESYKNSLVCELVKETFAILEKLCTQAISSKLDTITRLQGVNCILGFVREFDGLVSISQGNAGLPGASGKLTPVALHPAIRSLPLFVSSIKSSDLKCYLEIAKALQDLGHLLSRNDPTLVEGVLTVYSAFLRSLDKLSPSNRSMVFDSFVPEGGSVLSALLNLLATCQHSKIFGLAVRLVSTMCLLSHQLLRRLVDESHTSHSAVPTKILEFIETALNGDGKQIRMTGILSLVDDLLGCITEGHAKIYKDASRFREIDLSKGIIDTSDDNMDDSEIKEGFDFDDDEIPHRSFAELQERRAEFEIRMHRLQRTKLARHDGPRMRRRHFFIDEAFGEGASGAGSRASDAAVRELLSGTRVRRGQDWKWGDQDGGQGCEGVVISGTEKGAEGWIRVQWDAGGRNGYRWGAEEAYDVQPVHSNALAYALQQKDAEGLEQVIRLNGESQDKKLTASSFLHYLSAVEEGMSDERDVQILQTIMTELSLDLNTLIDGKLPLNVATERGRKDIVDWMLSQGANTALKDSEGLDAIETLYQSIQSMQHDSFSDLYSRQCQLIKMFESELSSPAKREFVFMKDGGQRNFGRNNPGFRFPMPSNFDSSSFTVRIRFKPAEVCCSSPTKVCLLSFGVKGKGREARRNAQGFGVFLSHGYLRCGPGLCSEPAANANISIYTGRWCEVTCVYCAKAKSIRLFVDGFLRSSVQLKPTESVRVNPEGDILVGLCPENLEGERCSGFLGSISHVSIYNTIMSDADIQESFTQRKTACTDSHPELQVPFSEHICRVLLDALKKPIEGKSGKGQTATKRHMMYILSKVLPYCSKAALMNGMENLISLIDMSTYESELSSHKSDFRNRLNGKNQPNYISALICMDTIMRHAPEVFKEPITRCGAVARVRKVAQLDKSPLGGNVQAPMATNSDLIQNASKFIISQYFEGDSMEQTSKCCEHVKARLTEISGLLRSHIDASKCSSVSTMPRHEVERELRWKLKQLLQNNDGVYVEELMNSDVPLLLTEYLEVLATNTAAFVDPIFEIDEPGDLFDDSELLSNLVQLLRQACDKLPMESSQLLPLVIPESDFFHLGYRCLRQKVLLRFEKAKADEDLPDLSSVELRAEPLCLNSDVRAKLINLMKTSKNKSNDDAASQRDVRFVMQNFAHDSESTPHFLIQRMRSLAECESRALSMCPALQRSFEALPELNTWHKETPSRGSAKRTLRINLNQNEVDQNPVEEQNVVDLFGRHRGDMEDEDYEDEEMFEGGDTQAFMAACSSQPRYQPTSQTAAGSDFEPPPLKLQIIPGKEGRYGYRPFIDFLQLESDSIGQMTSDDSSEDRVPTMERAMERKAPGAAKEKDAAKGKSATEASQAQSCVAVDLEDEQTLFEAITRLSALKEEAALQDKRSSVETRQGRNSHRPHFVHPNKFWEKTFTIRYSRDIGEGEEVNAAKAGEAAGLAEEDAADSAHADSSSGAHDVSSTTSTSSGSQADKEKRKFEFLKDSKLVHCIKLYDLLTHRYHKRLLMLREHLSSQSIGLHIRKQLDDPLTVGSGILTKIPWLFGLCNLHALVPFSVRERFFYASALGVCRALLSLDVDHDAMSLETTGIELMRANPFKDSPRLLIASRSIISEKVPELQRETIEIDHRREGHEDKPRLIEWAKEILHAHASKETVLDVTWRGEAGHGSGPTRKFYEKVAAIIEGQEGEEEFTQLWRDVGAANKEGLFPEQLPADNERRSSMLSNFEFIGLFIGKAIQQRQMPGLCLAKPFYKLLIGQAVDVSDLKGVDEMRFQSLEKIMFWAQEAIAVLSKPEHARDKGDLKTLEEIEERVQYLEFADGSAVTVANLQAYAEEELRSSLSMLRVEEQVEAVRRGISCVFPWRMLSVFSPEEMQQKLWSDLQWDEIKLEKIVRPGPMWPEDKEQINWLRKEMLAMDMPQRRAFIKFVTASVCMPPEENPIIVHPQVTSRKDMEDWDRKLPTCRTCANYLYLPPYSSHLILQERLGKAIWEEHIAFD